MRFFLTGRVRLCAPAGLAQPGDFFFQCLKPFLLAIDHIGQLLEHRQQFKLTRRQLVSCDIRRDEFFREAHDLATERGDATKVNIAAYRLQLKFVAACGKVVTYIVA
jgi:hypothetical protein